MNKNLKNNKNGKVIQYYYNVKQSGQISIK